MICLVVAASSMACNSAPKIAPPPPPSTRNGGERITGREFLLTGQVESTTPAPYGLYSYLLFGSRPSAESRPRYLAAIQAYLDMLPSVQGLEREGVPRKALNVTYLPVKDPAVVTAVASADPLAPEAVLQHYSYERARVLLAKVPGGPRLDGPYLVSYREPLGRVERLVGDYGWVDMSAIPAARVRHWIRIFIREAAKQDYWERAAGARVWTSMLDELDRAGEGAPQVLKALVFWVPGK